MFEALELVWPTVCAGCDLPGAGRMCAWCRADLGPEPLPERIPCVRGGVAACRYASPAARVLRRAKYGADPPLMRVLSAAFADATRDAARAFGADVVVPAPSPWNRRIRRGFAPAAVLASALARATDLPLVHALALRAGPRQAGLAASARASNARGRVRLAVPAVHGRVLLVDDVVTTGATAAACATELLGGGASEVWLVALTVAPPRHHGADRGGSGQLERTPDSSERPARPRGT